MFTTDTLAESMRSSRFYEELFMGDTTSVHWGYPPSQKVLTEDQVRRIFREELDRLEILREYRNLRRAR